MTVAARNSTSTGPSASTRFNRQQRALLESWMECRTEWNVHLGDNAHTGTEMIVVALPPYLDVDGLGLNLRNWVIYPDDDEGVRVLFWDDQESRYSDLDHALNDIAWLRASKQ